MFGAPRVPIHIVSLPKEEPQKVANDIYNQLMLVHMGNSAPWAVDVRSDGTLPVYGIAIAYLTNLGAYDTQTPYAQTAILMCEALKHQGIEVQTWPIPSTGSISKELSLQDDGSISIFVGDKPNYFWWNKKWNNKMQSMNIPAQSFHNFCSVSEEE